MLKANLIVLQIVKDEADHAHDLFLVREVKNLRDVLHDVQLEVLEQVHGKLVVAEDPEAAAHVVSDLSILLTFVDQQFVEDHEAALVDELLRQLVDSEQVHQAVRVCGARESRGLILGLEQEVKEVDSLVAEGSFIAESGKADKLG